MGTVSFLTALGAKLSRSYAATKLKWLTASVLAPTTLTKNAVSSAMEGRTVWCHRRVAWEVSNVAALTNDAHFHAMRRCRAFARVCHSASSLQIGNRRLD